MSFRIDLRNLEDLSEFGKARSLWSDMTESLRQHHSELKYEPFLAWQDQFEEYYGCKVEWYGDDPYNVLNLPILEFPSEQHYTLALLKI
jgi:hypothetical protein